MSVDSAVSSKSIKEIVNKINATNLENKEDLVNNILSAKEKYDNAETDEETEAAKLELYNIIPLEFKTKSQTIKDILNNFSGYAGQEFAVKGGTGCR